MFRNKSLLFQNVLFFLVAKYLLEHPRIYTLWGRERFHLRVKYFQTNLVYPFTVRVTGIIKRENASMRGART